MLTEKTFHTGTVSINYAEGPAYGLPLVMLHGATQRWQHFLPVLPLLASRYHVYALDMRGHGHSGRTPGAYRVQDFASDLVHFLQERVGEPSALLGYSMGGVVAFQATADTPTLVQALILAEPAAHIFAKERLQGNPILKRFGSLRDLLNSQPSLDTIIAAERNSAEDSVISRLKAKSLSQIDPDVFAHLSEHQFEENFRSSELAQRITCPVLLLQGDTTLGAQVEDQDVERARTLLANCTHVRVAGAGHNLHTPKPLEFYQLVSFFLESI